MAGAYSASLVPRLWPMVMITNELLTQAPIRIDRKNPHIPLRNSKMRSPAMCSVYLQSFRVAGGLLLTDCSFADTSVPKWTYRIHKRYGE